MKKVLALTAAGSFLAGSLFAGSVAIGATNYVQALKGQSTVSLNGKVVEKPPVLTYDGTTYVQLYSIQEALQEAGIQVSWTGENCSITVSRSVQSDSPVGAYLEHLPEVVQAAKDGGSPVDTYGLSVSGVDARAIALAVCQKFEQMYGESFTVFQWKGHDDYNIAPTDGLSRYQDYTVITP